MESLYATNPGSAIAYRIRSFPDTQFFKLSVSTGFSDAVHDRPASPGIYPAYTPAQFPVFAAGGDSTSPYVTLPPQIDKHVIDDDYHGTCDRISLRRGFL